MRAVGDQVMCNRGSISPATDPLDAWIISSHASLAEVSHAVKACRVGGAVVPPARGFMSKRSVKSAAIYTMNNG